MINMLHHPDNEANSAAAQEVFRRLRAEELATHWRKIETAPKDGRKLLVYLPEMLGVQDGNKRYADGRPILKDRPAAVMLAHWVAAPVDSASKPLSLRAKGFSARGGYWSARGDGHRPLTHAPTHWMPVPAAPRPSDRESM